MSRCAWIDADGVQCPAGASRYRGTDGSGAGYCRQHDQCRGAHAGREITNEHAMRGKVAALSDADALTVARRLSESIRSGALSADPYRAISQVVAERKRREAVRAATIYRESRRGHQAAGMDKLQAHEAAIAAVYQAGRVAALRFDGPVIVTGRDKAAGE